jgi:hypothetical protein
MGLDDMTLFFAGRDAEAPAGAGRVSRDIGQAGPSAKRALQRDMPESAASGRRQGAIWN